MQGSGQKWGSSDGLQRAESFARSLCNRVFPRRGQSTTTGLARGRQSALRDRNFLTGSQQLFLLGCLTCEGVGRRRMPLFQ